MVVDFIVRVEAEAWLALATPGEARLSCPVGWRRADGTMQRASLRYVTLTAVQTLCAVFILYYVSEAFRVLTDNIGVPQTMPSDVLAHVAAAAIVGQCCYWIRFFTTPVPSSYRSIVLGHLFAFASRLLFIFGGALFSLYFLRHLPAMEPGTLNLDFAWRIACLLAVLFALYCYSLELDRIGAALQAPAMTAADGPEPT